jgi:hypothetical protein
LLDASIALDDEIKHFFFAAAAHHLLKHELSSSAEVRTLSA